MSRLYIRVQGPDEAGVAVEGLLSCFAVSKSKHLILGVKVLRGSQNAYKIILTKRSTSIFLVVEALRYVNFEVNG